MGGTNGKGVDVQAAALLGFKVMYAGMARAIEQRRMRVVPCLPDGEINTVSIGGRHYKLVETEPGALKEAIAAEPAAMAETAAAEGTLAETREINTKLVALCRDLLEENKALRSLIGPGRLETSLSFGVKMDEKGDIVSAKTMKLRE